MVMEDEPSELHVGHKSPLNCEGYVVVAHLAVVEGSSEWVAAAGCNVLWTEHRQLLQSYCVVTT